VSNIACGEVYDEVTIFRMPDAAVRTMPDTAVCENDKMQLYVIDMEGDAVSWSRDYKPLEELIGENPTITVTTNGTYTATVSNQCGTVTNKVVVERLLLPAVKLKYDDTTICYGETLNFNSCIDSYIGSLQWEPNNNTNLTEPARYVVIASTEKCGKAKDSLYLNIYKPLILLPENRYLPEYNKQDVYDLKFQTLQAEPELTYSIYGTLPRGLSMSNGHLYGRPELGPYDYNTHRFQVFVTDGHQCSVTKEYILTPGWKTANVLLPLRGNENAVFLPDYELEIYNRNGLLVHRGMGWDGRWNNALVPPGTYFYKAKIKVDSKPEERMGFVVIMYY
jgi:hypothetical protein